MSSPAKTSSVTPLSLAVDAALVLAFFAFMAIKVLPPHVPSTEEARVRFWAAFAAACMSGVFWFCIQMFRVVLRAQRESGKQG
jgi:hypothetical protein